MTRSVASSLALLALLTGYAGAAKPRGVADLAQVIDAQVEQHLRQSKLTPAPLCEDAEFLRRAYLDIAGRVPTSRQAAQFLDSTDPDKRRQLIDELLASPHYGEQFGRVWRDWIAPAELPSEGNGGNQPIKATQDLGKWLGQRFNQGDGWDKLVRTILTVEGTLKEQPQGIFYSLVGDDMGRPQPAGAARAITSLFMGVQLQCAECHDDPFKSWKQADFWGTAAFFRNMNWKFNGRYFDSISENFAVDPKAKNAGKKGPGTRDATPNGRIAIPKEAFKNAGTVIPAKFIGADAFNAKENQPLRPVFADWLTARDNPYFARAFVNRTWAYFFARGIVHPLDDMRDDNPPSHPALLKQLTEEFIAADFDVRHLIRCIANSRTYQRTSRPSKERNAETVAAFGRLPVRIMSADVFYDSLRLALADPGLDLRSYDPKEAGRFGESSPVGTPYDEFVRLFATNKDDATDFRHGIPQFLALINHPRLRSGGKAVEELLKAKLEPAQAVETLYLSTLSRRPTPDEAKEAQEFVALSKEPRQGYSGVLWMLINRSEFLLVR